MCGIGVGGIFFVQKRLSGRNLLFLSQGGGRCLWRMGLGGEGDGRTERGYPSEARMCTQTKRISYEQRCLTSLSLTLPRKSREPGLS